MSDYYLGVILVTTVILSYWNVKYSRVIMYKTTTSFQSV